MVKIELAGVSPRTALAAREDAAEILSQFSERELSLLENDWRFWARPAQLPRWDEDWRFRLWQSGRNAGKTRAAAEAVVESVGKRGVTSINAVGRTYKDTVDVMIEGPSGILACARRAGLLTEHKVAKSQVLFPQMNAVVHYYSADAEKSLRGPACELAWVDELGAWKQGRTEEDDPWTMLDFTVRLGPHPRTLISTTPRPTKVMRWLNRSEMCLVTVEHTDANAENVSPKVLEAWHERYDGTRSGRQEMAAELLEDVEGAYWSYEQLDALHAARPAREGGGGAGSPRRPGRGRRG